MDLLPSLTSALSIIDWDQSLFFWINGIENPYLDFFLPVYRHKLFWVPLYLFIVAFLLWNFSKNGLWAVLFAVLTIGVSDTVSSKFIKKSVQRVRPCNDMAISRQVTARIRCGGGYSFTSSHATNHAALAFFLVYLLQGIRHWWGRLLIAWALTIGISQIYVGVHYPSDVLAGWMIGGLIGWLMAKIFHSRLDLS